MRSRYIIICLGCIGLLLATAITLTESQTSSPNPYDTDSFEVDPSAGGILARWEETTEGSGLVDQVGDFYHNISNAPYNSITANKTFTRDLRGTSAIAEQRILFAEEIEDGTGYNTTVLWDEDYDDGLVPAHWEMSDPSSYGPVYNTGNKLIFKNETYKYTEMTDDTLDKTTTNQFQLKADFYPVFDDPDPCWYNNFMVRGIETGVETPWCFLFQNARDYFEEYHYCRIIFYIDGSTKYDSGEMLDYTEWREQWHSLRLSSINGTFTFQIDQKRTGSYTTLWQGSYSTDYCFDKVNVRLSNTVAEDDNYYYWDNHYLYLLGNVTVSRMYNYDFFFEGDNGEEAGIRFNSLSKWQTFYTHEGTIINGTVPSQPFIEWQAWYKLQIQINLHETALAFKAFDETSEIWSRDWDDFWVLASPPSILEAKNLTLSFRVWTYQYNGSSEVWIDWTKAPFMDQKWRSSSAGGSWCTDHSPYSASFNGSGTGGIDYKVRWEHWQAYSGLATIDANLIDNTEYTNIQFTLRYVDSDGNTDSSNNLVDLEFTCRKGPVGSQYFYVILDAKTATESITKTFSTSPKASIGFLMWRQPSTNKVWLKTTLYDETNNTNKVILSINSDMQSGETNEYEMWQSFGWNGNDTDSYADLTVYSTDLYRSQTEIEEPSLPWPEKPPEPAPPYIFIVSDVLSFLGWAFGSIVAIIFTIFSPVIGFIQGVLEGIFSFVSQAFSNIVNGLGQIIAGILSPFTPYIAAFQDFIESLVEEALTRLEFMAVFWPWFFGVVGYVMVLLSTPETYLQIMALIITAIVFYIFAPTILDALGFALGFGDFSLGSIFEGIGNRTANLIGIVNIAVTWLWEIAYFIYDICKFVVSLIPFIG